MPLSSSAKSLRRIAVWLKRAYSGEPSMRVSHETIYRTIYLAGRRELGPKPGKHLRSGRTCGTRAE